MCPLAVAPSFCPSIPFSSLYLSLLPPSVPLSPPGHGHSPPALMGHLLGNGGHEVSYSINFLSPLQP